MTSHSNESPGEFARRLPDFLAGQWHVQIVHTGAVIPIPLAQSFGWVKTGLLGSFEGQLSVGDTTSDKATANLMLTVSKPGSALSSGAAQMLFRLHGCEGTVNASFSPDCKAPTARGFLGQTSVGFFLPFHQDCALWKNASGLVPGFVGLPDSVSVILQKMTDRSWFLDACFVFRTTTGSKFSLIRSHYWHAREPALGSPATGESAVLFRCDTALDQIEELESDAEDAKDDVEELLAAVEDAKDRLEEKTKALADLKNVAKNAKEEATSAIDDFESAVVDYHLELASNANSPPDIAAAEELTREAFSTLDQLEEELSSLEGEAEDIGAGVDDTVDELRAILWTDAAVARGERILREFEGEDLETNLDFLGDYQKRLNNLAPDTKKIAEGAVRLFEIFKVSDRLRGTDCSPVVAQMVKCCERTFADVFEKRKAQVLEHASVQSIITKPALWKFEPPPDVRKVDRSALCNMLDKVFKKGKKKEKLEWHGTQNCGLALLLFGGQIRIRQDAHNEILDLLRTTADDKSARELAQRLIDFQEDRNGFIHHDLATFADAECVAKCFQSCLRGLLAAFYAEAEFESQAIAGL